MYIVVPFLARITGHFNKYIIMQRINRRNTYIRIFFFFFYILIWQKFSFEKKIFKIESRSGVEQKRSGMKMEETEQSER